MEKSTYETPKMEVIAFKTADVITASGDYGVDGSEGGLGGLT